MMGEMNPGTMEKPFTIPNKIPETEIVGKLL